MWGLWYRDEAKGLRGGELREGNVSRIGVAAGAGCEQFAL